MYRLFVFIFQFIFLYTENFASFMENIRLVSLVRKEGWHDAGGCEFQSWRKHVYFS